MLPELLSSGGGQNAARRLFDSVSAALGLLILSPALLAIAIVVLIDDGRPVFFRHSRIGRGGRPFGLLKFRSMHSGSRGAPITAGGDRRITRFGRLLRKYKLDELPQLWNVLHGDMSLVGPRPEAPDFVQAGSPVWREILSVRPGITDIAALVYRDEEELLASARDPLRFYRETILPAKLELNRVYIRGRSLRRDLELIFLTLRYAFVRTGFDAGRLKTRLAARFGCTPGDSQTEMAIDKEEK